MEKELADRFDAIEKRLKDAEEQLSARAGVIDRIKAVLLQGPAGQASALWMKLKLVEGRKKGSEDPKDYDILIESSPATDQRWKLDVNDRYQKAVGTVVTLATLALGGPFIFLKNLTGESLLSVFTQSAVWGESLLGASIVCAMIYYFFSAKWVKLALLQKADFFKIPLGSWFVEKTLDLSYFLMVVGFLAGVFFVVKFMATYVPC
jgi:hypothetical protein